MTCRSARRAVPGVAGVLIAAAAACGNGEPAVPLAGAGATQLAKVDGEYLDARILGFLADNDIPGATVAVTKNSRLVWSKGYGHADAVAGTQMQPDTRSRIGSVSKIITTIGALGLVEDGDLDLDQPVYGSSVAPLWGSDPGATPGVVFTPDGLLDEPGTYVNAMVAGVDNLGAYFPPAEHLAEMPSANWALLNQAAYEKEIGATLDWAEKVRLRHLLSHTSGLFNGSGGAKEAAAEHFGKPVGEVDYSEVHQAVLMGMADGGKPWLLEPGSQWDYSNHGMGVAGFLAGAASPQGDYRAFIEDQVLAPLGLFDVVPNNDSIGGLDAQPHNSANVPYPPDHARGLNPDNVSRLGLPTGGWSASSRDLARLLCSIDHSSNHLRSLDPQTVTTMESDAVPGIPGKPLGWDGRNGNRLSKNGDIRGGSARIMKFLPDSFDHSPTAEINVAIAVNKGDSVPPAGLLRDIAQMAADADIPPGYDLFDPAYPCRVAAGPALAPLPGPAPAHHPDPTHIPDIPDIPGPAHPDPTHNPGPAAPAVDPAPERKPDPAGPVLRDLRVDPGRLSELWREGWSCEKPAQASVSVRTGSELHSVQLGWRIGDHRESVPMTSAGAGPETVWSGQLGPFDPDTVSPDDALQPITVTVSARDNSGHTGTADTTVTLQDCAHGIHRLPGPLAPSG